MKKTYIVLLFLLMSAMLPVLAQEFTFKFKVISSDNQTVAVTGVGDNSLEVNTVTIPSTYVSGDTTYTVTAIADSAFNGFEYVKTFEIPNTIIKIGNFAFLNCRLLENVVIPASVESIGINPFVKCTNLSAIEVEEGSTHFMAEDGVLYDITNSKLISCPPFWHNDDLKFVMTVDVNEVAPYAFTGLRNITRVTLSDSVRKVGEYAFVGADALQYLYFGDSIRHIEAPQFLKSLDADPSQSYNYTFMQGIYFSSLTTAPYLDGCIDPEKLEEVKLYVPLGKESLYENSTQEITEGEEAATGFADLMRIVVGQGYADTDANEVPLLYQSYWNEELEMIQPGEVILVQDKGYTGNVVIPDTIECDGEKLAVKGIDGWAFGGSQMKSVHIPATIGYWEENPFSYVTSLTSITVDENSTHLTAEEGILYSKAMDTLICFPSAMKRYSYTTPASVKTIAYGAILNCSYLTDFESGARSVEGNCFVDCNALANIVMTADTIDVFNIRNCPGACVQILADTIPASAESDGLYSTYLIVPNSLLEAYQSADEPWSTYKAILSSTESGTFDDNATTARTEDYFYESLLVTLNFASTNIRSACLPVAVPISALDALGVDVFQYSQSYYDDDLGMQLQFVKLMGGKAPANKPLIFRPKRAENCTIELENVLVTQEDIESSLVSDFGNGEDFVYYYNLNIYPTGPSTSAESVLASGVYSLGGGKLGKLSSTATIRPNRWYIQYNFQDNRTNGMSAGSLRLSIGDLDEISATTLSPIEEIGNRNDSAPIYNLNGQRIARPSGLSIINGKLILF